MVIPLWRKRLSPAVLVLCLVSEAHAADVAIAPAADRYEAPALSSAFGTIRLDGPIEIGDAAKVRNLLYGLLASKATPRGALVVAELNSESGDYAEAIKLGEVLRDFFVATVVRKSDQCMSSCVLVFLGGTSVQSPPEAHASSRNIEIGAKVGFKNYYAKAHDRGAQAPEYPVAAILDYTERMGVEHGFTTRLLDFALGQLVRVETVEQFSILRTCPIGLEAPKTNLATQAANLCNQSTGRFDPDARLTTTEMNAAEFRRRILDYAERNIWWLGVVDTKSKLADRLHSSEFRKNDEVAAQLYADLKAAGIPLPSVVGSNFEVYGYNNGPYQMKCFASVSPVEADKYELIFLAQPGVTRTSNATGAARAAPDQCRGLLRRNRNEVINPHQH